MKIVACMLMFEIRRFSVTENGLAYLQIIQITLDLVEVYLIKSTLWYDTSNIKSDWLQKHIHRYVNQKSKTRFHLVKFYQIAPFMCYNFFSILDCFDPRKHIFHLFFLWIIRIYWILLNFIFPNRKYCAGSFCCTNT